MSLKNQIFTKSEISLQLKYNISYLCVYVYVYVCACKIRINLRTMLCYVISFQKGEHNV